MLMQKANDMDVDVTTYSIRYDFEMFGSPVI